MENKELNTNIISDIDYKAIDSMAKEVACKFLMEKSAEHRKIMEEVKQDLKSNNELFKRFAVHNCLVNFAYQLIYSDLCQKIHESTFWEKLPNIESDSIDHIIRCMEHNDGK